ncbi:hypothetical protein HPB48_005871 [Haemaphysalis longicornis]|uniref:Uncharacterized protein n=1 Tax=Haemaphysalis longicornis TaxID=44386 RepID=A0A9J6GR07_HAELO|nr:hypothetical protein HPB48_005871 [Haemaphysalis longicornis]
MQVPQGLVGQRGPSRGLRVAMFGVMTFMLIAVISVIVVTLFAVVFLSRKSQDVVMRRMHPEIPPAARLAFELPPKHLVQTHERMVRRRPVVARQKQKRKRAKKGKVSSVRRRAQNIVAKISKSLASKLHFKRQKKHPRRRKAKATPPAD